MRKKQVSSEVLNLHESGMHRNVIAVLKENGNCTGKEATDMQIDFCLFNQIYMKCEERTNRIYYPEQKGPYKNPERGSCRAKSKKKRGEGEVQCFISRSTSAMH